MTTKLYIFSQREILRRLVHNFEKVKEIILGVLISSSPHRGGGQTLKLLVEATPLGQKLPHLTVL